MVLPPVLPGDRPPVPRRYYALAVLACVLTAGLVFPLQARLAPANIVMLFVMTVVLVAVKAGRGPAVLASVVGVGLFDFLFVPPQFSFAVTDAQYLLTFAVMLAVSLIVGALTAGLRSQAREAERRERMTRALYGLARTLAGALSVEQVDEAVRRFLAEQWQARAWLLPPADAPAPPLPAGGPDPMLVRFACDSGKAQALTGADGGPQHYLPLTGATRNRGVLVVFLPAATGAPRALLGAVASLVSTAVERLHFVTVAHEAQVAATAERLRSSILSALSHDVRTPLTALYGMADALALAGLPGDAGDTAAAIRDQALRVSNMVGNLLDMARLHSGRVSLRREWQPVEEVVGASLKLLAPALAGHPLRIEGLDALPLLAFDAVLIERVLCNLLENAAKYSPADAPIVLSGSVGDDDVELRVCGGGAGFPPDKLVKVFALFERGRPEDAVAGMGIGLAICQAIVDAHGGTIRAFNPDGGGACVAFTLPRGTPPAIEAETLPPEGTSP